MAKRPRVPRDGEERRLEAYRVKNRANLAAQARKRPEHKTNQEEDNDCLERLTNFRKGLPHSSDGEVSDADYDAFREACESQKIDSFQSLKIGTSTAKFRKWESPTAGAFYDLEGPDAQAVTMPPAPKLGSNELAMEMAEVYLMALLRDVPFTDYESNQVAKNAARTLDDMPRKGITNNGRGTLKFTTKNLFRGEGYGVTDGPMMSQFILVGTPDITVPKVPGKGINSGPNGFIEYGAQVIDQRVRTAIAGIDYMQDLDSWLQVQRGEDIPNVDPSAYVKLGSRGDRRFITTGRDISTYVHFDALYQAYLNACLIMLASQTSPQPGLPHQAKDIKRTKGFAQFGGPHILTLVTEVATRALKAVRYQKFTQHRRGRPEQLAGLISQYKKFENATHNPFDEIKPLVDNLDKVMFGNKPLLQAVYEFNEKKGYFLPMAFPEGSPMHPSYGAGHATVAGACVTALKAFFVTSDKINDVYTPNRNGEKLTKCRSPKLDVLGELNKLAANISIGRNMAGVHYYSDYTESVKMGEQITLELLEEQAYTYPEKVVMEIPMFFSNKVARVRN